jgi:hypothetical protein
MTRTRFVLFAGLAAFACAASAQLVTPRLATPEDLKGAAISRSMIIQQQAAEARDWVFYHSVQDLPPNVRTLLLHVASNPVVGPGEPFNDGDVIVYPASSQFHFAAVADNTTAIVWYSGSFNGAVLHVLIYDKAVRDACRYDLPPKSFPGPIQWTRLLNSIRASGAENMRFEYLKPGAL